MKRVRISFGILCAIVVIAVIAAVCHQWHVQGCGWFSLIAAIAFYAGSSYCVWRVIDEFFADIQHRYEDEQQSKED